jgi:hypothetical protein
MAFNYNINVTGDCNNTSDGIINLGISGGSAPYTVQWITPQYPTNIVLSSVTKTNLVSDTYSIKITDGSLPENQVEYLNIPVSSGVCCSILNVGNTTCSLNNGSVTGTSTTQYSSTNYSLYHGDGVFSQSATTNQDSVIFGSLTAGTYYMTVLDLGGCTGRSQNFIVEESEPLNYGLYMVPNSACGGTPIGKITITGITGQPPFSMCAGTAAVLSSWPSSPSISSVMKPVDFGAFLTDTFSLRIASFLPYVSTSVNSMPSARVRSFSA